MRPAVSATRDIGASLFNDKWVRVCCSSCTERHVAQMAFAECHDMISASPADRSDQPFGIRILPW
jgi:hypothetical protein